MLVGSAGELVSASEDPPYLAAVAWYESRGNPKALDGTGTCVGLVQLHRSATWWLPNMDPAWEGITLAELWEPETNVRGGYTALRWRRDQCGEDPVVWVSSYRYGHCVRGDAEGRRRVALARRLMHDGAPAPTRNP